MDDEERAHHCRHAHCDGEKTQPGRRIFADKRGAFHHESTAHPECRGTEDGCELSLVHAQLQEEVEGRSLSQSALTGEAIFRDNERQDQQREWRREQLQQQQRLLLGQQQEIESRVRMLQSKDASQHNVLPVQNFPVEQQIGVDTQRATQLPEQLSEDIAGDTNWNGAPASARSSLPVRVNDEVPSHLQRTEPPCGVILSELISSVANTFLNQLRQFAPCTRTRRDLLLLLCTSNISECVNVDDDLAWGERLFWMGAGASATGNAFDNDDAIFATLLATPLERVQFLSLLRAHLRDLTRWVPTCASATNGIASEVRSAIDSAFIHHATHLELTTPGQYSDTSSQLVSEFIRIDQSIMAESVDSGTTESNSFSKFVSENGSNVELGSSASREAWEDCAAVLGPQMIVEFLSFYQSLIDEPNHHSKALMLERLAVAARRNARLE